MKKSADNQKNLLKFFSEIFMLKREKRNGFRLVGIDEPDSLADHAALTAQIAYIIAEMEGLNGSECATMALFHDNGEARITDHHKVASRYIDHHRGEAEAYSEQMSRLPSVIAKKLKPLYAEKEARKTKQAIVVQDADWLEVAMQAKIYLEQGYQGCQDWIDNVDQALKTKSAKNIFSQMVKEKDFTNIWWQGLKNLKK